jgi:hypothetical protein
MRDSCKLLARTGDDLAYERLAFAGVRIPREHDPRALVFAEKQPLLE